MGHNLESPLEFPVAALEKSDQELGVYLFGCYVGAVAQKHGILLDQITQEFVETVRQNVLNEETTTAENAALEKALHKAANGDVLTAGKIFREFMENGAIFRAALDEAATGRRRQRSNAKRLRTDPLQSLIQDIMMADPRIKSTELMDALRKHVGGPVIEEITEDEIFFVRNGRGGNAAPISGLKDRMSRARKKILSR